VPPELVMVNEEAVAVRVVEQEFPCEPETVEAMISQPAGWPLREHPRSVPCVSVYLPCTSVQRLCSIFRFCRFAESATCAASIAPIVRSPPPLPNLNKQKTFCWALSPKSGLSPIEADTLAKCDGKGLFMDPFYAQSGSRSSQFCSYPLE